MPRNSGRSGLTTTWPIRRSPSERSEFRCALFPPIFDLICVTFSCAICLLPVIPGGTTLLALPPVAALLALPPVAALLALPPVAALLALPPVAALLALPPVAAGPCPPARAISGPARGRARP